MSFEIKVFIVNFIQMKNYSWLLKKKQIKKPLKKRSELKNLL